MKKIGILTFHRAVNYGAALQVYALSRVLSEMGADAYVIDYRCPFIENSYRLRRNLNLKQSSGRFVFLKGAAKVLTKKRRFRSFSKNNLSLTKPYTPSNIASSAESFDVFLAGSDQVWNLNISGKDHTYMLDFIRSEKENDPKKYSYAVSMGDCRVAPGDLYLLASFSRLSVREKSSADRLAKDLKTNPRVDVDPTLLLPPYEWKKLVGRNSVTTKPYIFIYSVHPQNRMYAYAKKLASERGYEIYHLHNRFQGNLKEEGIHVLFDCSPEQFLTLIYNAACVVTNSFHGTVFSIIFHRPFLSELETKAGFNNRVWELLQMLHIPRRILDEVPSVNDGITMEEPIDWESVDATLQKLTEDSLAYLSSVVNDESSSAL